MKALRERLGRILLDPRVALWAPPVVAVIAAVQMLAQTRHNPLPGGYTQYNNFIIFRQAFVHLVEGKDLYAYFPAEHFDNFLYTPTFAALMAPLAWPPTWLGLVLWDLLNAAVLVLGIRAVPGLSPRSRALFVWFILMEFIGSAQHSQTNPMIVGLLLLSLSAAEKEQDGLAPLFLVLAGYVKIFPIAAGLFLLTYPRRVRLVLWCGVWALVLGAVPLLVVSPSELAWQYGNWVRLHTTNPQHAGGVGITTEGILYTWFGLAPPRAAVVAAGAVLTALPLVRVRDFGRFEFRAAFLGLLLMWMIAFNHLSESPTFVIAMSGIALWYFTQRSTPLHRALLWIAFVFVSLAYSDLSPTAFRKGVADAYALKGAPVLLTWMVAVAELTLGRSPGPRPASAGQRTHFPRGLARRRRPGSRYPRGMEHEPFRVRDGSVRIYRILDVADAIDLARAEAAATAPASRMRLPGSRSALEVAHPPLRLRLGERRVRVAGQERTLEVQASLFDYGVVSVLFELPVPAGAALDDLVPLAEALLERPTPELDEAARAVAAELAAALAAALHRPHVWEGLETYTVFFVRAFDRRVGGEELAARAPIDRLLLGETDPTPLSAGERADVLKHRFAYLETDLAVVDWNSAFVHEPSGSTDVPDLLELATAQLLEMRWYDAFLDRELAAIRGEVERAGSAGLFTRRYNRLVRRTAALLVELSETVERVENAVKIVGDFYLARLYQAATRRFRLPAWQESVLRKHRMLAEVNRVLADGADVRRAELLEITIIVLIAWEIAWAFWRP